jgi:hypothetical protein
MNLFKKSLRFFYLLLILTSHLVNASNVPEASSTSSVRKRNLTNAFDTYDAQDKDKLVRREIEQKVYNSVVGTRDIDSLNRYFTDPPIEVMIDNFARAFSLYPYDDHRERPSRSVTVVTTANLLSVADILDTIALNLHFDDRKNFLMAIGKNKTFKRSMANACFYLREPEDVTAFVLQNPTYSPFRRSIQKLKLDGDVRRNAYDKYIHPEEYLNTFATKLASLSNIQVFKVHRCNLEFLRNLMNKLKSNVFVTRTQRPPSLELDSFHSLLEREMFNKVDMLGLLTRLRISFHLAEVNNALENLASAANLNELDIVFSDGFDRLDDVGLAALSTKLSQYNFSRYNKLRMDFSRARETIDTKTAVSAACIRGIVNSHGDNSGLQVLKLAGMNISYENFQPLANCLATNKRLQALSLSFRYTQGMCFDDRYATSLATALTQNHALRKLKLKSHNMSSRGLLAIVKAARVRILGLSYNPAQNENGIELSNEATLAILVNQHISDLRLQNYMPTSAGYRALLSCPHLTRLELGSSTWWRWYYNPSTCSDPEAVAKEIGEGLAQSQIQFLRIRGMVMKKQHLDIVFQGLVKNRSLRTLDFSGSEVGVSFPEKSQWSPQLNGLVEAIKVHPTLNQLGLNISFLIDNHLQVLAKTLKQSPSVKLISVQNPFGIKETQEATQTIDRIRAVNGLNNTGKLLTNMRNVKFPSDEFKFAFTAKYD